MLKYFIDVTENLITPGVMLGMLFAYMLLVYRKRGVIILAAGTCVGVIAAGVYSYFKNATKLISTPWWNLRIFPVFICAFVLFIVADLPFIRKRIRVIAPVFAAIMAGDLLFYSLPDVMAYPYNFVLGGQAVFSTGFLYRLIGMILGLVLVFLAGLAVYRVTVHMSPALTGLFLKLIYLICALQFGAKMVQIMYTRRLLSGRGWFKIAKFSSNQSNLFIYAAMAIVLIIPIALWIRSFFVNEPYENPAQKRKIKAKWRSNRRWSTAVILCFAMAVLNITAIKAYANRPVELSPTEECEVRGDNVYVPLEQVDDGHLHRFDYETPNGVKVRFIVIKKPNSSAYGVGLDACDICGETGYFERNGQIVCKLCDVVMNINTIGFKGGCNPKVIDYSISNGYIIVPTYTLIEHEKDFR